MRPTPTDSELSRRRLASKKLRLSVEARLQETEHNSQIVTDYGSGKTYVIRETVQKAFKEFLRQKQPKTRPQLRKNSFHTSVEAAKVESPEEGYDDKYPKHLMGSVIDKYELRHTEEKEIKSNGEPLTKQYVLKKSDSTSSGLQHRRVF